MTRIDAMTDMPLLRVDRPTKRYGPRIGCADVAFDLWPGEVLGIVGESGSGKSTLLSCLAGHLTPDEGRVIFDTAEGPRDVLAMSEPDRRRLSRTDWAYVHQNPRDGLRMGVTAGGNVGERLMAIGARHYGDIRARATDWLSRVEIAADRIDDRPTAFSGGMQQRASIARALSFDPDLLLMDEPFGALDEIVRDKLNEQLLRLWEKTQKTVVFVTHSIPEAVFLSTKIVVMSPRPGKIHDVIACNFPKDRTLDIRETPEFLDVANRVRQGLREGHSYVD